MKNMNKTSIGIIVAIIILGGAGAALLMNRDADKSNSETSQTTSPDAMEKKDSTMAKTEDEAMMKKDDSAMQKTDDTMMKKAESYVTLTDYDTNKDTYKDQKKVYFFHASWCPICKAIHDDISADPSQIPSGTTFIKTDFDTSTALRQKYGVTTQYTFVQVDNDGNEVAQWTATNLDKAVAGIN